MGESDETIDLLLANGASPLPGDHEPLQMLFNDASVYNKVTPFRKFFDPKLHDINIFKGEDCLPLLSVAARYGSDLVVAFLLQETKVEIHCIQTAKPLCSGLQRNTEMLYWKCCLGRRRLILICKPWMAAAL
jgi:hypothetical protein